MNGVKTNVYVDDEGNIQKIKIQRFKKQEKVSDYTMKIGSKLVVNQLNKQAKKNRGREVEVIGFLKKSYDDERKVKVRYLDTNRPGKVEIGDLDIIRNETHYKGKRGDL